MDKTEIDGFAQLSDWLEHCGIRIIPAVVPDEVRVRVKFQPDDSLTTFALQRYVFSERFKNWLAKYNIEITPKNQLKFPNEHVKTLFLITWS